MDSQKLDKHGNCQPKDKASRDIEIISVFNQNACKSFQQILEDAFIHRLNSDIDIIPATIYTNIYSM